MVRMPSRFAASALAGAASLAIASCGGAAKPADLSPAAKAKWNEYCAYRTACGKTDPCPTTACVAGYANEAPLIEFVDCQTAKSCDVNDDECTASAGTTDAEREDFTARCIAALTAGQDPMNNCYIEPVICTVVAYPLIRKEIMHAFDACLPVATCQARVACIDAAGAPLLCN